MNHPMTHIPPPPILIAHNVILLVLLTPTVALCAAERTIGMDSYFRMVWGLLIVLGIILLLYGLLRKRFSLLASTEGKNIKITELKPLGSRKMLCLVEVKGEEFLLGVSGDSITHLATLQKKQTFETALHNAGREAAE